MPRPTCTWRLRTRSLHLGPRTILMAILNLTPDSFSDGGCHNTPDAALAHALALLDQGADILDLGGESTRPNATPITPTEEQARILPTLEAILHARPDTILSVDTFHAETARAAIRAGAEIVNDVSGLTWDPAMARTCADLDCATILMHARGTPQTWSSLPPLAPVEVLPLVLNGLRESITTATAAGIPRDRLVLDPGFGFGKRGTENFTLLAHLPQLQALQLPLLAGISRKGFLTQSLPNPSTESREQATLAANTAAILTGAHILRVHDVAAARHAAHIADQLLNSH